MAHTYRQLRKSSTKPETKAEKRHRRNMLPAGGFNYTGVE
jgi:hypothetical protein